MVIVKDKLPEPKERKNDDQEKGYISSAEE